MSEKLNSPLLGASRILILLAAVYFAAAILAARNIIVHTTASTNAIEQILIAYNMKNEGSLAIDHYAREHPFLGTLFASPIKHELELPSGKESAKALSTDLIGDLKAVRHESSIAAWWSWALLNLSLVYVVMIVALKRSVTARAVLFSLTTTSVIFFFIGILAPAMVIWTAPSIPMESGKLEFVLQHQVRGIAAIIWELLTTGHGIIGAFLLLFSILTPLTKAGLTYFVTGSESKSLNFKIGEFLHTIGKWSMADVFVAGILLSLFALKAQEATKSIPCLGLYYFMGYCLLSMMTAELLMNSGVVSGKDPKRTERKLGKGAVAGLFAAVLGFMILSSLYTYQQYTMNTHQEISTSETPQKLNNADLVLPAHQ